MLSCFSKSEPAESASARATGTGLSSLDSVLRILESIAASDSDGAGRELALSGLNATARIGVQIIEATKVRLMPIFALKKRVILILIWAEAAHAEQARMDAPRRARRVASDTR